MEEEFLVIRYRFEAADGTRAEFVATMDRETMEAREPEGDPPPWTALDFRQCPHCPLDPQEHPHCPAAVQLPALLEAFDHLPSHAEARVEVSSAERTVSHETSVQQGMGALMGLLMATSGCPVMAFFRPMARFHLPFATPEETTFRAVSTYLLATYLRARETGEEPSWSLDGLTEIYRDVHVLNKAMAERIRAATSTDSSVNALIVLDMLAVTLPMDVGAHLPGIRETFQAFLRTGRGED